MRQFRVGRYEFRRVLLNLTGGLTNDPDIADNSILMALALSKGAHAAQTLNIFGRSLDRLCNVFEIKVALVGAAHDRSEDARATGRIG